MNKSVNKVSMYKPRPTELVGLHNHILHNGYLLVTLHVPLHGDIRSPYLSPTLAHTPPSTHTPWQPNKPFLYQQSFVFHQKKRPDHDKGISTKR